MNPRGWMWELPCRARAVPALSACGSRAPFRVRSSLIPIELRSQCTCPVPALSSLPHIFQSLAKYERSPFLPLVLLVDSEVPMPPHRNPSHPMRPTHTHPKTHVHNQVSLALHLQGSFGPAISPKIAIPCVLHSTMCKTPLEMESHVE